MINIVLFGPPGAGKGTQAENLIEKYKFVHFSTGDILRAEIAEKTKLGMEAKTIMDKGELVPDEVVIGMIRSKIGKNLHAHGFIFDGFPRTGAQAEALDNILSESKTSISAMIMLDVEHGELIKRLLKRGEKSGRADDQDMKVIENRIRVYHDQTAPVKNYYDKQGKVRIIKGVGTIEEIFGKICSVIEKL